MPDAPRRQKALGKQILEKRKRLGISQRELARILEITQAKLSRIEGGAWSTQYDLLIKIRAWLGSDPAATKHRDYLRTLQFRELLKDYMEARNEPADSAARENCLKLLEQLFAAFKNMKGTEGK